MSGAEVAVFAPDLADRSRFDRSLVRHVRTSEELDLLNVRLIVVDLDRCPEPASFLRPGVRAIGFASHIDTATQAQAREAGFDLVVNRSLFFRDVDALIQRELSGP